MSRDKQRLSDYLGHILEAIERIDRYTENMDEVQFLQSEMVQDAVIRNFEIIGEASFNIQKHYPEFYPFFLCLARTGMRLGEAIAVATQDIDFNSKYIWVKKSYRRGKFNPPKNGKARKVDMSDQLTDVLKGLMTTRKKEALKSGTGELPDLLFTQSGGVMEQNFVRKIHNRILRKAGIRKIRIHDLRHT